MMFEDLWNYRLDTQKSRAQSLAAEIGKIDQKIEQLLDRIVTTDSPSVIRAYENRIKDFEVQKYGIEGKNRLSRQTDPRL